MSVIGFEIKAARKLSRKTQQEVADELGVSVQAISQWENGHTDPSAANLVRLKDIIGLSLDSQYKIRDVVRSSSIVSDDPQIKAPVVPWEEPEKWDRYNRDLLADFDFSDEPEEFYEVKWKPIGDVYALKIGKNSRRSPEFLLGDVIIVDTGRAPEKGDFVLANLDQRKFRNEAFLATYWPIGVDEYRAPIFDLDIGSTERIRVDATHPGTVLGTVRELRRYFRLG